MNLDDLKNHWESEHANKSVDEIRQLIDRRSQSVSARSRRKALIEAGAFLLLLLVFFTGLDPERNSLWVNVFLVLVVLMGIVNNVLIYRKLLINRRGDSLAKSLKQQIRGQWHQLQLSVVFSVLLFAAVFTFLLSGTEIHGSKLWIASIIFGLSVALRSWFEIRRWKKSIRQLSLCQMDLGTVERNR
jgi:hypothetical protein